MNTISSIRTLRVVLLYVIGVVVAFIAACSEGHQRQVMVAPEWSPFVDLARRSECADVRNRLFVVDQVVVFWDRAGNCPDNSYGETLYGNTADDLLCALHDSIAGPIKNCPAQSYEDMFEIMVGHLDQPDLGLGSGHTVQQLPL